MRDLVVLVIFAAFTVVCVLFVHWCDRIVGPDVELGPGAETRSVSESRS